MQEQAGLTYGRLWLPLAQEWRYARGMASIFELHPHPGCRTTLEKVEFLIWREEGFFDLDTRLFGSPLRVKLPQADFPGRRDELWRTTCFEVFIRPTGGEAYFELNLSPSGDWASYRFDSYRSGMRDAKIVGHPDDDVWTQAELRMQEITFDTSGEPELDISCGWDIGLSAVIEETDSAKSYWALVHGSGPPDFHNAACFAYHLPSFEPE